MYIIQTFDLKVLKSHKMISIWSHPQRKERNLSNFRPKVKS